MGFKKKSKVSAEFSMSSLTDIIFLLLIFFMLTSSLVAPNALNLKLPGSSSSNVVSSSKLDDISISKSGKYRLNGKSVSLGSLERSLSSKTKGRSKKLDVTISPERGAPTESVVAVMDIAMQLNINGILALEKD